MTLQQNIKKGLFIIILPCLLFTTLFAQKGATNAIRGYKFYQANKYEDAAMYFTKVIAKNPQCDSAYYYRGTSQYYLKRTNAALQDLNKAILYNPNMARAYYFRGQIFSRLGNDLEAIKDFTKVVLLEPRNANGYYSLGVEQNKIEKYKEAHQNFSKVIRLEPGEEYAYAYRYRGFTNYMLGKQEEALQDLNKYIELSRKESHWVYKTRGNVKYELKDYEGAIQDYNKAIKLGSTSYKLAYRGRAKANVRAGNLVSAIDDFTRVIELDPKDVVAYERMGHIMIILGDKAVKGEKSIMGADYGSFEDYYKEAIDYFEKAIKYDPEYFLAFYSRGRAYEKLGEYDKAITDYERTVLIQPDFKGEMISSLPPEFIVSEAKIADPNNDSKLEEGETITISLPVKNTGGGRANNLKIEITEQNGYGGLQYKSTQYWGEIVQGEEKNIVISISGKGLNSKGTATFDIKLTCAEGVAAQKTVKVPFGNH